MGGVISRWALRDMETRLGQQHRTRLFVSMDAPQQGANVPTAYQHLARHLRSLYLQTNVAGGIEVFQWITGGFSPYRTLSLADRPASRQMLINWVNGSGNIDNSMHDTWETELRNLGYPTQNNIRVIAISNGTECGTTQPFGPGAELLNLNGKANTRFLGDLYGMSLFPVAGILLGQPGFLLGIIPGRNDIKYEFIANAQPQQGNTQRIYHGKISYTKKVLYLIPVTVTITERNRDSDPSLLPTDYYAGGAYPIPVNSFSSSFQNALVKFNINFAIQPAFCFVPTPSALDIGSNNVALTNTDYLARYIGGAPPTGNRSSPFQNFVTAFNGQQVNEQHIGFYQRNGNWLATELSRVNPADPAPQSNCSPLCNNPIIAGPTVVCTSSASYFAPNVAGATYTWIPGAGITINGSGANSSVNVNFEPSSSFRQLRVVINSPNCGVFDRTLSIQVGTAPPNVSCNDVGNGTCTIVIPRCQELYNSENAYSIPNRNGDGTNRWLWEVYGGKFRGVNNTSQITEHYDYVRYVTPDPGTNSISISIKPMSVCGLTSSNMPFQYVVVKTSQQCSGRFSVSPNPATSTFNISPVKNTSSFSNEKSVSADEFTTVEIRDKFGNLKKVLKYLKGTKFASINISSLPTDTYIIRIMTDKTSEEHKLNVIR